MSNELVEIFNSVDFGDVRSITINEEIYFVGRDIAICLEYPEPQKAVSRYCEDGRKVPILDKRQILQQTLVIPESDVYLLIFRSKNKEAKKFRNWFTKIVLPSIRRTGRYGVEEAPKVPTSMKEALKLAYEQAVLIEEQQEVITIQTPKAEFYDEVASSESLIDIAEVSKIINIKGFGRNNLFKFLKEKSILRYNKQPYQRYMDSGFFKVIEQKYTPPNGVPRINLKTMVYQKGLDYIRKLLKKELVK